MKVRFLFLREFIVYREVKNICSQILIIYMQRKHEAKLRKKPYQKDRIMSNGSVLAKNKGSRISGFIH